MQGTPSNILKLEKQSNDPTKFAFQYTDSRSKLNFYLKPQVVNHQNIIVAEEATSPDAYYLFKINRLGNRYTPPIIRTEKQ